jgi:ubiquinol-cytochrome c reductase cytochrome c subunit
MALACIVGGTARADLTASYDGQLTLTATRETAAIAGALGQASALVNGTIAIALSDPAASGVFYVHGKVKRKHLHLAGENAARTTIRWAGTIGTNTIDGKVRIRTASATLRGLLTLTRRAVTPPPTGGASCDPVYFADQVMANVLSPICSHCHVAGGAAATTSLRVTPSDLVATQASVNLQVDVTNPSASRLIQKPLGVLPHGGGQQITAGSPEEQILTHWADIVSTGNCGGGGGGGTTGPDLYASNCQSCHGTDARGVSGKPNIRCNAAIHDVVVSGKGTGTDAMPAFTNLSDAQIALIQAYLSQLCTASGRTPDDVFGANCATCHGTDARGTATGPEIRCRKSILSTVRSGVTTVMPAFASSALSDTDVSAILGYLEGLCTADAAAMPADLYLSNCATCHGTQAHGGRDATGIHGPDIQCSSPGDMSEAIQEGPDQMPKFPELLASDVTAITAYVEGFCTGTIGGN